MSISSFQGNTIALLTEIYKSVSSSNTDQTFPLDLSDATSRITFNLNPSLQLSSSSSYKLEILRWTMVGNLKNVNTSCNHIALTRSGTAAPFSLTPGMYDYADILASLKAFDVNFGLSINMNTARAEMVLPAGYVVRTDEGNSLLRRRFGFTANVYTGPATFISEEEPSISDVSDVCLCCDLVENRTITKRRSSATAIRTNILWSTPAGDLTPNRTNSFEKTTDLFYPLLPNLSNITQMSFWLVDQEGREIADPCELSIFARICQIKVGTD